MSIKKTIITAIVGLTLVAMIAPGVAQGVTIEDLLAQIAQLQVQLLALQGGTTTPSGTVPAACTGITLSSWLKKGDTGAEVKCVQALLNTDVATQVAISGVGSAGSETTYYGNLTVAGVKKFQAKYGTGSLGTVGPNTRAKMNSILVSGTTPTTPTDPTTPVIPTGAGLTAALAYDNPASGTIVNGQAQFELAKLTFTNGDNAEVMVTQLKLKRIGISADASLSNVYLFNGATRLTDGASVSSQTISFNDSMGLFKVPAGGTVTITVAADVDGTAGETIAIQIVAATDITTNSSSVNGVFPLTGNLHSIATGTLASVIWHTTTTPSAADIDPQDDYVVFQNSVVILTRAVDATRISFRKTGSVNNTDLQNFRLYIDGVQIGPVVANLDANGYVTFDLTSAPKRLEAGTRNVKVMADIIGGSNLTFTFNLWSVADSTFIDSQYGAKILSEADADGTAFTKRSTGEQSINSGVISITKLSDSPSGNIVDGATNALLAKFQLKASGESVKIETLKVSVVVNDVAVGYLRNGILLANGVQIGSTSNLYDTSKTSPFYTSYSLGSSLIVVPGSPVTLEVKADIYDNDGTDDISTDDTIKVRIEGSSSENNAEGRVSAATIDAPSSDVDGNSLTVKTGSLSLSKATGYSDHTVVAPLSAYKVASFNLNAATTEAVNITAIDVTVDEVSSYASNLYVVYGGQTTPIKPTVSAANSWSINYTLAAGTTIPLDVYMDVSSSMSTGTGTVDVNIDGTTASSAASSDSTIVTGQALTYSSGAFAAESLNTPTNQIVSGNQLVEVARFRFSPSYQTYTIQEIKIDPDTATNVSSTAENVISYAVLKDGTTVLGTENFNNIDTSGSTGGFYFTGLNVEVPAGSNKTLIVEYMFAQPNATNSTTGLRQIPALTYVKYMDGQGTVSTITDAGTSTYVGNSTWAYKAVPTLTSVDLPNPTAVAMNSVMDLYKFKVTAPDSGDVSVKQFKIALGWSDAGTADLMELESLLLLEDGTDITSSVSILDEDGYDATDTTGVSEEDSYIIVTWLTDDEVIFLITSASLNKT